jgi:hypothetical protein
MPDELDGPLITCSADMRIAVVFSKQQAAEAEAKIRPALFLCVNIPKSALFRSWQECGQFFDAEVAMDLELASGRTVRGAEERDLACIEGEDFAILYDGRPFIQCAVSEGSPNRYILEYQDGSEDKHYLAVDEQITLDRVLSAFRKYLGRDPSWRTDFRWEKLDLYALSAKAGFVSPL